jgi:uncharacterized membrane protein
MAEIEKEIIIPNVKIEITDSIEARKTWKKASNVIEAIAQALLVLSTVFAFAAGYFDNNTMVFFTGCCNVSCLALMKYATYASNESNEYHKILIQQMRTAGVTTPIAPVTEIT